MGERKENRRKGHVRQKQTGRERWRMAGQGEDTEYNRSKYCRGLNRKGQKCPPITLCMCTEFWGLEDPLERELGSKSRLGGTTRCESRSG